MVSIDFFSCDFFHKLHELKNNLYAIESFYSHIRIYWKDIEEDINNSIEEKLKNTEKKHHEYVIDNYIHDFIDAQNRAPRFYRETVFVSILSQVEYYLLEYCSLFNQDVLREKNNFDDLNSGKVLSKIKDYMINSMEFKSKSFSYEWDYLENIKIIRNALVHSNGAINRKIKQINKFCKKNKNFESKKGFITLKENTISDVVNTLITLIEKLEDEQENFIERHQEKFGIYNVMAN
ncbi:hypothetical protein ISO56_16880 [Morganella morganii subsp. morganii]|uniref:hypothetical protein n=1 Tax=Morganella morganii TaxID=582 RepID=UPI001BD96B8D|nr:hypothetical protein [Morganella morganii]MBT0502877.1 hypothetical protein [Morganella morganii subsp. morganii]QWM15857.1 hypothetical protein IZ181_05015 [Morganella morganii subsp. morganii]